jgi:hypothetical protein
VSALDDLAAHLGDPARPFDPRALELLQLAIRERNGELPPKGHMGDDLDVPFETVPTATSIDIDDAVLAGGWIVQAAVIPVPGVGNCPALVLRFSRYDGHLLRPVVLCLDAEQMSKVPALVQSAAYAAIRRAG